MAGWTACLHMAKSSLWPVGLWNCENAAWSEQLLTSQRNVVCACCQSDPGKKNNNKKNKHRVWINLSPHTISVCDGWTTYSWIYIDWHIDDTLPSVTKGNFSPKVPEDFLWVVFYLELKCSCRSWLSVFPPLPESLVNHVNQADDVVGLGQLHRGRGSRYTYRSN